MKCQEVTGLSCDINVCWIAVQRYSHDEASNPGSVPPLNAISFTSLSPSSQHSVNKWLQALKYTHIPHGMPEGRPLA